MINNIKDTTHKVGDILIAIVLRSFAATVWCFVYIALMWFFDNTSTIERVHGFSTLIVGFIIVVTPKSSYEKNYWVYGYLIYSALAAGFLYYI